ncbi:MAG: epoxyqueuosine reductase [Clostridia bacterium]|nr:epoxyqueuosine reductase [Clostridia bacterium]
MTAKELLAAAAAAGCTAGLCPFEAIAEGLLPCRAASRLPQTPQTVLCVLFPYRFAGEKPQNLSRYAAVPDYHTVAGAVLEEIARSLRESDPTGVYEAFMDNSPLPEVRVAVAAGLGVRGDNGLFYSHEYGSFVFIGAIVTDRAVGATAHPPVSCPHCGACASVCPTAALSAAGVDRARCLSAITQKKGELTTEQAAALCHAGSAWGCDICQEICPLNRQATVAPHPCFTAYRPTLTIDDLEDLHDKAYGWRGRAVVERNLRLLENFQECGKNSCQNT